MWMRGEVWLRSLLRESVESEEKGGVQDKAEASGIGKKTAILQETEHRKVTPVERMTL